MFLERLEEKNKSLFLELCFYAANANGIVEEEEEAMIYAYCREMDIPQHIPETKATFEEILSELKKNTTLSEKKIVLLESIGLVKVDGIYDKKEQEFIERVASELGCKETLEKLSYLFDEYMDLYKKMYVQICE